MNGSIIRTKLLVSALADALQDVQIDVPSPPPPTSSKTIPKTAHHHHHAVSKADDVDEKQDTGESTANDDAMTRIVEDSRISFELLRKIVSALSDDEDEDETSPLLTSWKDVRNLKTSLDLPSWLLQTNSSSGGSTPAKHVDNNNDGDAFDTTIARLEILFYLVTRLQQTRIQQQRQKHVSQPKQQGNLDEKEEQGSSSVSKQSPQEGGGGGGEDLDDALSSLLQMNDLGNDNSNKKQTKIVVLSESQRRAVQECCTFMQADYQRRKRSMRQRFEILQTTFAGCSSTNVESNKEDDEEENDNDTTNIYEELDLLEHFTKPHSFSKTLKKNATASGAPPANDVDDKDVAYSPSVATGSHGETLGRPSGGGSLTENESRMSMPEWSN